MTNSFFNSNVNDPNLYMLLQQTENNVFATLNCLRVGIIDKILDNNMAQCSIGNKKLMGTNADGSAIWQNYAPIFARLYFIGNSENYINYPVKVGQLCLLFFCDREIESVFATGEVSSLNSTRMHNLTDCICLPLSQAITDDFLNIVAEKLNIVAQSINISGNETMTGDMTITGDMTVTGNITATTLNAGNGTSGSFVSQDNKTISVANGIITSIS